jgi:hypothetical protein
VMGLIVELAEFLSRRHCVGPVAAG